MAMELAAPKPDWATLLRDHARRHAPAALGLGLALLGVLTVWPWPTQPVWGSPPGRCSLLSRMKSFRKPTATATRPRQPSV